MGVKNINKSIFYNIIDFIKQNNALNSKHSKKLSNKVNY